MATKTVTMGAATWKYVDVMGIEHTITTSQDFTITLTDESASRVLYAIDKQDPVSTTDGYKIHFRPQAGGLNYGNVMVFRDSNQGGTIEYRASGEMVCACPVTGIEQRWKVAKADIDDVDTPTVFTSITWEDQFGNEMKMAGPTVA